MLTMCVCVLDFSLVFALILYFALGVYFSVRRYYKSSFTLHYITLHYITLQNITLYYITLHYITKHKIILHDITLQNMTLQYITLHYKTLHYITLYYITLHYKILLHYITLQGKSEFIGRALCKPVVKMSCEEYSPPKFPPRLEWWGVYRGTERAGELLATFELLQVCCMCRLSPLAASLWAAPRQQWRRCVAWTRARVASITVWDLFLSLFLVRA